MKQIPITPLLESTLAYPRRLLSKEKTTRNMRHGTVLEVGAGAVADLVGVVAVAGATADLVGVAAAMTKMGIRSAKSTRRQMIGEHVFWQHHKPAEQLVHGSMK